MTSEQAALRPGSSAASVEMCSVHVGEALFGLAIGHILEIIGAAKPRPVPLAPSFVGGLVHYRGEVLATVSLRSLLGLPSATGSQDALVIENPAGSFGLLVDAVGDVLTVSSNDFEPVPSTLSDAQRSLFLGAYKLKHNLMIMLDPERLDPIRLAALANA